MSTSETISFDLNGQSLVLWLPWSIDWVVCKQQGFMKPTSFALPSAYLSWQSTILSLFPFFFFFLTSWFPCMLELLLSVYIPCFLTSYKSFLLLSLEKWTPFYFSVILYIYIVHASFQQRCFLCNLLSFWISYLIWQRCERWKIQ